MKLIKLSLVAAVIASSLAADAITVSGDVSLTSNALWRGASLTDDTATIQGTIGIEHESGVYAGAWGTGLTTGSEIDLFVGYATEISGISIDGGFVAYTASNSTGSHEHILDEFGELYLGASYDVGVELGATLYKGVLSKDKDSTIIEATIGKDLSMLYVGAAYGI
ncbi:MAG: TorF family putative porin [Campylobacterota bacterium]|nr:TorF family putative porin [Campylobacterota bacterium]